MLVAVIEVDARTYLDGPIGEATMVAVGPAGEEERRPLVLPSGAGARLAELSRFDLLVLGPPGCEPMWSARGSLGNQPAELLSFAVPGAAARRLYPLGLYDHLIGQGERYPGATFTLGLTTFGLPCGPVGCCLTFTDGLLVSVDLEPEGDSVDLALAVPLAEHLLSVAGELDLREPIAKGEMGGHFAYASAFAGVFRSDRWLSAVAADLVWLRRVVALTRHGAARRSRTGPPALE
jgi:hypothetical protein